MTSIFNPPPPTKKTSIFSGAIKSLAFIGSVLAISFSLSYLVSAWTEPNVNPPNPVSGVFTPLNSGNTNQSKSGWLGIGGAFAPVMPLDVRGSTAESLWVRNGTTYFFAGADNANKRARIGAYEEGVGWKNLIINEGGGNVGIGTTGPGAPLHVAYPYASTDTTERVPMIWRANDNGNQLYMTVKGAAAQANRVWRLQTSMNGVGDAGILALQSGGGNVGIGTTSPNTVGPAKLDVRGHIFVTNPSDTYSGLYLSRSGGPTSGWDSPGGTWAIYRYGSAQGDRFNIGIAGVNEPFTILTNGNVGIGKTDPSAKLEVNGGIKITSGSGGGITFSDNTVQTTAGASQIIGAGDYVLISGTLAGSSFSNTSWITVSEIKMDRNGSYRIRFMGWGNNGDGKEYRVLVNGGQVYYTPNYGTSPTKYYTDQTLSNGDVVTLQVQILSLAQGYWKKFAITSVKGGVHYDYWY